MTNSTRNELPYYIARAISGYRAGLQAAITQAVREKMASGEQLTAEAIGACAASVVFGDSEHRSAMEEISMSAYHEGKYKFLDDVIAELENELPSCPS